MRIISDPTVDRTDRDLSWSSGILGLTGVFGAISFFALLHSPFQAFSASLPGSSSVTLAWDLSPSPEVTGYRVYYGAASGNYSNSVVVGNVTTNTIRGLAGGVTFFFAVTAYSASGLESDLSNEVTFVPSLSSVRMRVTPTGQVALTVKGVIDHRYDILATEAFADWIVIGTVVMPAGGSWDFTDTNAVSFSRRFYRIRG